VSIHDLSRVGIPVRFNMPFELGLACAVAQSRPPHAFILLESRAFRVQQTLSDLNGYDPYIHNCTISGTIECVLNALTPSTGAPGSAEVLRLHRTMRIAAHDMTSRGRRGTIFTRNRFLKLVSVGIERAEQSGLLSA
jgi:hypothetical protein